MHTTFDLIVAGVVGFFAGGLVGIFIMAVAVISGREDHIE